MTVSLTTVIFTDALYNWEEATNGCPVGWHLPDGCRMDDII